MHSDEMRDPQISVFASGLGSIAQPDNLVALWATSSRFFEAFAIVAVLGTVIGVILGRVHRSIFHGARDVVTVLYALPMVPFYPLFVQWLGLGARSEVAFGVIHGIIPVILITMTASANIDTSLIESGNSMGANRLRRMWSIVLPSVAPDVLGALKIGASLSLLGVLLGELMISVDGVGTFIQGQINSQRAAPLDAMILVICVGVILINFVLARVQVATTRWRSDA